MQICTFLVVLLVRDPSLLRMGQYLQLLLLQKLKFDGPLDVVAAHGFAGAMGTLAIPFVAPLSALTAGLRLAQFAVQLGGVIAVFVFISASAWFMLRVLDHFMQLRVSREAEELHKASLRFRQSLCSVKNWV